MKVNKHNTDRSHLLCELAFRAADYHFGQGEQGDDVGNDHEVVEHIRQLPHQIVAHHGAHQDEHQGDEGVDHGAGLGVLLAEKPDGVDLAEQVPAQNRGESEEEQADDVSVTLNKISDIKTHGRIHMYLICEAITSNEKLRERFKIKYIQWRKALELEIKNSISFRDDSYPISFLLISIVDGLVVQSLLKTEEIPYDEISRFLITTLN